MPEGTILNTADDAQLSGVTGEGTVGGEAAAPQTPSPADGAPFDYSKMVGAEGALADNWREGLPEAVRGEKCLDSFKTIGALAQSFVHAQRSIGANKITVPGENASPEEWDAFYTACGRPEAADKYAHDKVELPEGIVLDDAQLENFRKFAFENGLSQKAFEAALAFDIQRLQQNQHSAAAARTAEYNETLAKLRSEFGGNMENVVAQCNKAMETFGLADVLRDKGLLNNYTVIKALASIGERISESKLKGGTAPASGSDPASRLDEIRNNPDDAYYKKDHPAHNARVAEVNNLLAALAKMNKS